jgi:hypothetical protein
MPTVLSDVRCWGQSGKHRLLASISPFDPERKSTAKEVDQFDAPHLSLDSLLPLAVIGIPDNL